MGRETVLWTKLYTCARTIRRVTWWLRGHRRKRCRTTLSGGTEAPAHGRWREGLEELRRRVVSGRGPNLGASIAMLRFASFRHCIVHTTSQSLCSTSEFCTSAFMRIALVFAWQTVRSKVVCCCVFHEFGRQLRCARNDMHQHLLDFLFRICSNAFQQIKWYERLSNALWQRADHIIRMYCASDHRFFAGQWSMVGASAELTIQDGLSRLYFVLWKKVLGSWSMPRQSFSPTELLCFKQLTSGSSCTYPLADPFQT